LNAKDIKLLFLVAFLSFFIVLSIAVPAKSEAEENNARFAKVTYTPRIHVDTKDTWSFTIYNANCSESGQNAARFFLILYDDNELWLNEYNDTQYRTWSCDKSSTVTHNYTIRGWQVIRPTSHDLRVELYWDNNGTARLEDTTSFTIDVMVHIPLQHIFATGYFIAYLIICFALFSYVYIQGLDE
jgi:hypothetical protein